MYQRWNIHKRLSWKFVATLKCPQTFILKICCNVEISTNVYLENLLQRWNVHKRLSWKFVFKLKCRKPLCCGFNKSTLRRLIPQHLEFIVQRIMANHYITMLNLLLTSKQCCESVYIRNCMEYREYMYTKTGELNNLFCGIKKKPT